MKILGIDPGLRITGYAVITQAGTVINVIDAGIICADSQLPLHQRLLQLQQEIISVLDEHQPDIVAVENLYAHYAHPQTAILMGHARGIFLAAAAQRNINVLGFAATRVKKSITGNGRASKHQIQQAVTIQLNLKKTPSPPDVADALAIAMCCGNEHSRETILQ